MKPTKRLCALPFLALLGCTDAFLDPSLYEELPAWENLDFTAVQPSASFRLWELREGFPGGPQEVLARVPAASPEPIPAELLAQVSATTSLTGFDIGCLPGGCYKYFVTLEGTTIRVWNTLDAAHEFIGSVDNQVEAALVAKVNGFHWRTSKERGAIRAVAGGYELVVLDLVAFCAPVQTDRFLIFIATSGQLEIRKREVWERDEHTCI